MCQFNQCLPALHKMSPKTYTIWTNLTTHCSFCVRILKTVIAVCTQYVWAWVNFVHNLRCLLKNLRSQQKFYATAGPTGRDKYHLCILVGSLTIQSSYRSLENLQYLGNQLWHSLPTRYQSELRCSTWKKLIFKHLHVLIQVFILGKPSFIK